MSCRDDTGLAHDVRIQFSACEPHLLSLYLGRGRRTYSTKNINTPEAGYLHPARGVPARARGPPRGVGVHTGPDGMPDCVEQILDGGGGAVMSPLMTSADDYVLHLRAAMHGIEAQKKISAFHTFTDEEVERCLARSNVIECASGDRVLKKGGARPATSSWSSTARSRHGTGNRSSG